MAKLVDVVLNLIKRGTLSRVQGQDGHHRYQMRVTGGEVRDDIEVMQPYGLTTHPVAMGPDGKGPEGLLLRLRKGLAALPGVSDIRYLLKLSVLKVGDVALSTFRDKIDADADAAWQRLQFTEDADGKPKAVLRIADPEKPGRFSVVTMTPAVLALQVSDGEDPPGTSSLRLSGGNVFLTASGGVLIDAPLTTVKEHLIDNIAENSQTHQDMRDT